MHACTPIHQRNENDVDKDERDGKSDGRTEKKKEESEKPKEREGEKVYVCARAGVEKERESNITAHTFIGSMGIYWSGY